MNNCDVDDHCFEPRYSETEFLDAEKLQAVIKLVCDTDYVTDVTKDVENFRTKKKTYICDVCKYCGCVVADKHGMS